MRSITKHHREAAAEIAMDPGNFADLLDVSKAEIRRAFAKSEHSLLRRMAVADEDTFDNFMQKVLSEKSCDHKGECSCPGHC